MNARLLMGIPWQCRSSAWCPPATPRTVPQGPGQQPWPPALLQVPAAWRGQPQPAPRVPGGVWHCWTWQPPTRKGGKAHRAESCRGRHLLWWAEEPAICGKLKAGPVGNVIQSSEDSSIPTAARCLPCPAAGGPATSRASQAAAALLLCKSTRSSRNAACLCFCNGESELRVEKPQGVHSSVLRSKQLFWRPFFV